jgi:hypothetical protein
MIHKLSENEGGEDTGTYVHTRTHIHMHAYDQ